MEQAVTDPTDFPAAHGGSHLRLLCAAARCSICCDLFDTPLLLKACGHSCEWPAPSARRTRPGSEALPSGTGALRGRHPAGPALPPSHRSLQQLHPPKPGLSGAARPAQLPHLQARGAGAAPRRRTGGAPARKQP